MKSKKLISRFLVFTVALIMLITCLPPNLMASALGGVGGGQSLGGTGGGSKGDNDSLLNEEVGLRFSLVTRKIDPETGKLDDKSVVVETGYSGKYFIDVWASTTDAVLDYRYKSITPNTRYVTDAGTAVTADNIIYCDTIALNNTINNRYKGKYGVKCYTERAVDKHQKIW